MDEDEEVSFDLCRFLPEGCMPLGFLGAVKYLTPDGGIALGVVADGFCWWETSGALAFLSEQEFVAKNEQAEGGWDGG